MLSSFILLEQWGKLIVVLSAIDLLFKCHCSGTVSCVNVTSYCFGRFCIVVYLYGYDWASLFLQYVLFAWKVEDYEEILHCTPLCGCPKYLMFHVVKSWRHWLLPDQRMLVIYHVFLVGLRTWFSALVCDLNCIKWIAFLFDQPLLLESCIWFKKKSRRKTASCEITFIIHSSWSSCPVHQSTSWPPSCSSEWMVNIFIYPQPCLPFLKSSWRTSVPKKGRVLPWDVTYQSLGLRFCGRKVLKFSRLE